ncbi:MAG TPA: phospho-N-acetylmuramoyl-pentapeptide-transferase [Desulfotomaculum sp.]|nr:phospho-N-acetylmuramoyl-pentapeptide-transferase [Desulfotomaculum sp.]
MTASVAGAFLFSLLITVVAGPVVIPVLRRLKVGQRVRYDGPSRHLSKAGTPTMGGVIFLLGVTPAVLWFGRGNAEAMALILVMLCYGLTGFLDDFLKVVKQRPLGLRAREKLFMQAAVAFGLAVFAVSFLGRGTDVAVPFSGFFQDGGVHVDYGFWFFVFLTVLVLAGTANAVNLTDGLDGLAAGLTVIAAGVYVFFALIMDKTGLAVGLGAVAGGCLGFLLYNRHPARVFMGDTGSLALGGALGTAAVLTRSELFLLIIGAVFVAEALSVILQVASFQLTGRRIFRMSPLHHHFELGGWPEGRVVVTFWLIGLVMGLAGLAGVYGLG